MPSGLPVVIVSMPASRTSRPSSMRKLRASMTALTRPSPCGSKTHAEAASAGPVTVSAIAPNTTAAMHASQKSVAPAMAPFDVSQIPVC
jgi:hypothetical protein